MSSGVQVYIDSNGQLGTLTSSARFKEDVADMADEVQRQEAELEQQKRLLAEQEARLQKLEALLARQAEAPKAP
ncbi:MAG TPA: hypothetical protein VH988_08290 [Thermoanaerobaculia bacterium]|nr:hypothetical protein [Thermoanaerobaculia bacterium]